MKTLATFLFLIATTTLASVPLKWTVETSRLQPVVFDAVRGETLDLEATFNSYGKPLSITNNCSIFWQTNGMGNAWWTAPTVVASNRVSSTFTPQMDPGGRVVYGYLGSTGDIYRAAFTLLFRHGPGASPNSIPLPAKTLDWQTVTNVNVSDAPFALKGSSGSGIGTNDVRSIVEGYGYETVTNASERYQAKIADYTTTNSVIGLAANQVTNDVAEWALSGHPEPHGMTGETATNIVENVVRESVRTNYLCSVAAAQDYANAAKTAAQSYADGKFVRTNGNNQVTLDWKLMSGYDPIIDLVPQLGLWYFYGRSMSASELQTIGASIGFAEGAWRMMVGQDLKTIASTDDIPDVSAAVSTHNSAADAHAILFATKQEVISDLETIRSGASAGSTAVQSIAPAIAYTTAVSNKLETGKQDVISDLETIRSGAAAGSTAYPNASGIQLASQVATQGAYLNADDAQFVSTNYDSQVNLPEATVRIKLQDGGTNVWRTIWEEIRRWNAFTGTNFSWTTWGGFTPWMNNVDAALAGSSPKEYAFYDGVTGDVAPDGFFWVSQPRIAICAGAAYQRYLDAGRAVWILESNGLVANVGGTTNGYFRISDEEGNTQFEIIKGDKETVPAVANSFQGQKVMGVTHWIGTYSVTNAVTPPVATFTRSLSNPQWIDETEASCPCNVSWTMIDSTTYQLEFWTKSNEPSMFCKTEYERGGETRIKNHVPAEMNYIILNGTKYGLVPKTVNGELVMGLTTAN